MTAVGFLLLVLIGAICGFVAEMIVGFQPGGFIASVVVGFLGAMLGGWLARVLGLPSVLAVRVDGYSIELLWTVLGAILLLLVVSLFRRSTYYRRP